MANEDGKGSVCKANETATANEDGKGSVCKANETVAGTYSWKTNIHQNI